MKTTTTTIFAVALLVGLSSSLAAQRPDQRGPDRRAPAAWGGAGAWQPERLLRMESRLDLTEDQVSQLEALAARFNTEGRQATLAIRSQRAQLAEALGASDVNESEVRSHFDAAQAAERDLAWLRIESQMLVRTILTDDQWAVLQERARRGRGRAVRPGQQNERRFNRGPRRSGDPEA